MAIEFLLYMAFVAKLIEVQLFLLLEGCNVPFGLCNLTNGHFPGLLVKLQPVLRCSTCREVGDVAWAFARHTLLDQNFVLGTQMRSEITIAQS